MKNKTLFLLVSIFISAFHSAAETAQNTAQFNDFIRNCVEHSEYNAEDPGMKGFHFYHEFTGKYKVLYANKIFFSYCSDELSYTGGANGNHQVKVGSLRRISGKKISLKEIAPTPEQQKKLLSLVISGIAKHFKCSVRELSGKLLAQPFLHENFYLNEKGITFIYNEYEISCKADGTVFSFVPYSQFEINVK